MASGVPNVGVVGEDGENDDTTSVAITQREDKDGVACVDDGQISQAGDGEMAGKNRFNLANFARKQVQLQAVKKMKGLTVTQVSSGFTVSESNLLLRPSKIIYSS